MSWITDRSPLPCDFPLRDEPLYVCHAPYGHDGAHDFRCINGHAAR